MKDPTLKNTQPSFSSSSQAPSSSSPSSPSSLSPSSSSSSLPSSSLPSSSSSSSSRTSISLLPRLHHIISWIIGIFTLGLLIGIWQWIVMATHTPPTVLSSPLQIAEALGNSWNSLLSSATSLTAQEGIYGFLIAIPCGIACGLGLFLSKIFSAAFYPLLVIAQMLPLIAIAPLFIIWFGFEPIGKIIIVAIFSLFPLTIQTYRGLKRVPQFYVDIAYTSGASKIWTLFNVQLRNALPSIMGGMKIAAVYVFATAATAEYLGARNGLGIILQSAFNSFQTALIFASTFLIICLTALLYGAIALTEWILRKISFY